MDKNQALQNLLNGSASEDDIELLMRLLASGEISIGGNVNQSVIIIGSGNTVELPPAALDRLNARPMLGNLDRDLTGEEIASGLRRLDKLLPNRAPVLLPHYKEQVGRLRPTLKTEIKALSETLRRERLEALAAINSICVEAVDISFNGLALGEVAPDYDARSPFRGLESFRPEDSEFFFGREALTEKLLGKIKAHSFLAVLGASGSGKSSLVMAGVIPALDLDYSIFRPGTNPLGELESAHGKSLIVVDQFEELFTLTRDDVTCKEFIKRLLDKSSRAKIILTLRSDFLGEVGAYRALSAEIQNHLEIIPPMDMDELRRAMEGQAGVTGLRFEADLSQQILDDVAGEPGAMPLLQHALWELWNRRHGRNLRASEYRAFGGVKQAITSTAEKVYAECSKSEQDSLRDIFLRLTRIDEGDEGRDTRRRVPLGDLIPSGRDAASITLLLDKLANARLIVKTVNEDKTEVEVAHEALIRRWERLRIWLNEDRDALRLRESVSESAREWERSSKHESLLNSRWVKLDEALLLVQDSRYRLTDVEQAYLKGCVGLRNREQRERERRRKLTLASVSVVIVIIMAILVGWSISSTKSANVNATQVSVNSTQVSIANTAQVSAEEQSHIAVSRQLAAQAQTLVNTLKSERALALLLAIQSINMNTYSDAAQILITGDFPSHSIVKIQRDNLVRSIAVSPDGNYFALGSNGGIIRIWEYKTGIEIARMLHADIVTSVAFSPDSRYIASGSNDMTARVWEIASGIEVAHTTHDDIVTEVAFSPDGRYVVSGGYDDTARIWDMASGQEITHIVLDSMVASVAFSPNGRHIATGSWDKTVRIWDVSTGREIIRMNLESFVNSVAYSPDGMYLVSGSDDRFVRVWNVATGEEISRMMHDSYLTSTVFSPDGKYIASGSWDGTARVWEALTGKEISYMPHDDVVWSVVFDPSGKHIITTDKNNIIRLWKIATGDSSKLIHNDVVWSAVFSPDGKYVATGSQDQTVRVWDIFTGREVSHMLHDDAVIQVAFSLDGKHIISSSYDRTIRVWEVSTGKEIARMTHDRTAYSFALSPDNKYVVSGSSDNTVRIWELTSGSEVTRMVHDDGVNSVAFSPDGRYVASGSDDKTVRIWDAEMGKEAARMHVDDEVSIVIFSPDGKFLASNDYKTIHIWEVATNKQIARMSHDDNIYSMSFSPDSKLVASGGDDRTARIWDVLTGNEIVRVTHNDVVDWVAFNRDGRYVASGSVDNTARVWESSTGKEVSRITHNDYVNSVAFSPDDKYIVSTSGDGTARIWMWRPKDLVANACTKLPRNLTHEEWDQYIGDALPYQAICPNLPIEAESTPSP